MAAVLTATLTRRAPAAALAAALAVVRPAAQRAATGGAAHVASAGGPAEEGTWRRQLVRSPLLGLIVARRRGHHTPVSAHVCTGYLQAVARPLPLRLCRRSCPRPRARRRARLRWWRPAAMPSPRWCWRRTGGAAARRRWPATAKAGGGVGGVGTVAPRSRRRCNRAASGGIGNASTS